MPYSNLYLKTEFEKICKKYGVEYNQEEMLFILEFMEKIAIIEVDFYIRNDITLL